MMPDKLLWSIGKNDPKDFQELLSRTQKYANAEELMNSQRSEELTKGGEKRKKNLSKDSNPKRSKTNQKLTKPSRGLGGRFQ